ncbi:MAG: S-layer homology domain-containing protein [Microcoleus sp. SIO2G3]|nr:S-layer homology domain-containing protein [Microcoleus sp. SIO2G3]
MRIARCTGHFYQFNKHIRYWGYILIGSILSSTMLSAAAGLANPVAAKPTSTTANANYGGSLGQSLLDTMLGAEALRPQKASPGGQKPATGTAAQLAQGRTFPDIQNNWARSFIEVLAARGVILGFPDGTFRPDDPVTRVQFAAMIRKAFGRAPERTGINFVDVPPTYWGFEAIQAAYRTGFLEGYPNNIFQPEQNIPRVQVLVSLVSGLDLSPPDDPATVLSTNFQDAPEIPTFARNSVAAATLNQLVVNYPDVAFLNPNQVATRADVAAFIYQALVNEGTLPQLSANDVAADYIVGYEPVATPPTTSPDQVAETRQALLFPQPPVEERIRRFIRGGSSIGTPTAFGAETGNIFLGGTYQERARFTGKEDAAAVVGFGLGDARRLVALETAVSIYDLEGDTFEDGGVSFKVHRLFPGDFAVAVGVENLIEWGNTDGGSSVYGVASKVFRLRRDGSQPLSRVTASVGIGGGRFRSEDNIEEGDEDPNVFGSVGVQVAEPITVIAEWTGQDLNLGASIVPIRGVPLVITPAAADVTGTAGDGTRFILGVGYGISF